MKRGFPLAFAAVAFLGLPSRIANAQAVDTVRWHVTGVRRCAAADSLFGRFWRSHASAIRASYSRSRDMTTLWNPDRQVGWRQAGSSRLVGSEARIRVSGRQPHTDSARIELTLRFIDTVYRAPEQARLTFQIDDSVHFEIAEPQVDYVTVNGVTGIPLKLMVLLTPEQSLALASLPRSVKGTMGPYSFFLYDWELWDINSVYRGALCGIETP